jgi:hypothetical protein
MTNAQNIIIQKESATGLYAILIDEELAYECLANDEVIDVLRDIIGKEEKE